MKLILWIALLYIGSVNAFASDVTLELNVIANGQKPILSVTTNLPPKTILMATLANPTNQGGDGYFAQASSSVGANKIVQFGPFSKNGSSLFPGTYHITVTSVMAALQPADVQPFFGMHGENLTGSLVFTLSGTSEKGVSRKLDFEVSQETSSSTPAPKDHTIGSADETWLKVQSDGRDFYVRTNGHFFTTNPPLSTAENDSGNGFDTYFVANLPESTIVGAPESAMNEIEGNCQTRHFSVLGTVFFAGKNRSGEAVQSLGPEDVERKLVPNSPFEKAFDLLCRIAGEQK